MHGTSRTYFIHTINIYTLASIIRVLYILLVLYAYYAISIMHNNSTREYVYDKYNTILVYYVL